MVIKRLSVLFLVSLFALGLTACGAGTDSAIATGIAQTQQISQLETAAAAPDTPAPDAPVSEATATVQADSGSGGSVTTKQDVNMRAGDSTAYGVMTVIPGGETLQITGINQTGTWYQVLYHDATGWVSVDFTNGETPANLPVITPSAQPQAQATSSGGGGGGGGGGGDQNYSFTLDISNDGESSTVSGELTPGDSDYVTVMFEGFGGSIDTGHLRVQLYCSAYEDDVELSETIPRSNHSNECNGDWD